MTETLIERPALYAGPAAYRLTATQLNEHDGPYMTLSCPRGSCESNLLAGTRHHTTSTELDTLIAAAIHHDVRHTGAETSEASKQLREQVAALGEYRLYPDVDEQPVLILNCPYLARTSAQHCPDTAAGQCLANLLTVDQAIVGVQLGTLLRLAAEHEAARARALAELLGADQHAELVDRLAQFRHAWINRQQEAICIRETADGASAGIASARADLIGQLIAHFDKAVAGV
ncbi:hypothetical protein ACFYUV_38215 [Nonomuraea sp. NPDC003560]|uniref:hypothetical protein n=1 Tax=Nonomuraea sp. NPDC003560 TaxID=3364341 RepID=UPI00368994C9